MNVPPRDQSNDRAFVLALLSLAVLLRLFRLGYQSIWVDEMLTIVMSTPKAGYSIWHLLLHNIHGPLHAFAVFLVASVRDSDAWLRLPSAVAGVASVGVFYAWAARWLGRPTARVAALFLAIDPVHVHYSQEVRNYAFVFFFALVACYAFDRFTERPNARRGAAYALAAAAAALSNFSAAFVFAAHTAIYFMRAGFAAASIRRWAAVCAVTLALISPWVYRIYTYIDVSKLVTPVLPGEIGVAERLRGETTVTWAAVPYSVYAFSVGYTLGPSLRELHDDASMHGVVSRHWPSVALVAAVFGWLALAGAARAARRRRDAAELALYFALPIIFTLLLNWQNAKAFNARYVLLSLPAYLCLLALGAQAVRRGRRVALACAALMVFSLGHHYFDGRYAKEDVKRATRYIAPRLDTTRGDACILAPTVFQIVERYYAGTVPVHAVYARSPVSVDAQLDAVFAACNSLWYVRARPWVDDPDGRVRGRIEERYTTVESVDFDGVKVLRCVRKNDGGADG